MVSGFSLFVNPISLFSNSIQDLNNISFALKGKNGELGISPTLNTENRIENPQLQASKVVF